MYQAITTSYRGPTDRTGSRLIARCAARRMTVPYSHSHNLETNHLLAAQRLAEALEWDGHWQSGTLPNGDCCHVMTGRNGREYDHSFSSLAKQRGASAHV